jgi:hypothetical protein
VDFQNTLQNKSLEGDVCLSLFIHCLHLAMILGTNSIEIELELPEPTVDNLGIRKRQFLLPY